MKVVNESLDILWNLKIFEGKRHKIAQVFLMLFALVSAYQGSIAGDEIISWGVDLPVLPDKAMVILAACAAYFTGKMKKFVKEHKD